MPIESESQRRAMWAAASGNSTLGIPKSVGKEFAGKDPGGKLPERVKSDARQDGLGTPAKVTITPKRSMKDEQGLGTSPKVEIKPKEAAHDSRAKGYMDAFQRRAQGFRGLKK